MRPLRARLPRLANVLPIVVLDRSRLGLRSRGFPFGPRRRRRRLSGLWFLGPTHAHEGTDLPNSPRFFVEKCLDRKKVGARIRAEILCHGFATSSGIRWV